MHNLGQHHLFELLGWNPQAIILMALLWKSARNLRLNELYHMIVKQTVTDSLQQLNLRREMSEALNITMSVQVDQLRNWD